LIQGIGFRSLQLCPQYSIRGKGVLVSIMRRALGLESILRAGPLKIVLQQNRPEPDIASRA
jgi:hypothetical protein